MIHFTQQAAREQAPLADSPFHHWQTENGEVVALFYRVPDGYLLRFPGRGDFNVETHTRAVACIPVPNVSHQMITAVYQNQVLPLLLSNDGALILHASTVSIGEVAVGFLGKSGRGKSTLAAAFARAGYPFLSDDGLSLEPIGATYMAKPHRPHVRLWDDSNVAVLDGCESDAASEWLEKTFIESGPALPFETRTLPLAALCFLDDGRGDAVIERQMEPAQALLELIRHSFILNVDDPAHIQTQFDQLSKLANAVPCFTLDYPRRYAALPRVIEKVIELAQIGG